VHGITDYTPRDGKPLNVPNAKPVIVGDAIRRSVEDQAHRESRPLPATEGVPGDDSSRLADRTAVGGGAKASSPSATSECPRAWAHRPGTYCGACKRVIAK